MEKRIVSTEIGSIAPKIGEEKAIELVAKAGFDAFDMSMFKNVINYAWQTKTVTPANHPLATTEYLKFARKLKQVAKDNGIFCNQSHAPYPTVLSGIRDQLKRCIEITAEVGGKICVIHPQEQKTLEENAKMYGELLPFAKSHGVKIATENMWDWDREKDQAYRVACSDHESFLEYIKELDDDYFVACLDIGHAEMRGLDTSAVKMIKTLGNHLQALHIHDNDKHYDSHGLPMTMSIEFDPIIRALKEIGYKGDFTLECCHYLSGQEDVEGALKKAYDAVRELSDKFDNL